ncbi:RelA/SpoT domain-containing protein [Streptomyces sp. NPDC004330]|uniref:RelA/SpoT domain-containing protein n=1 Tax=Streptomyces sp. NPDC004330 TaxID=3364700 RepID=UPI0036B6E731
MARSKGEINRAGGLLRGWHADTDLGGKDLSDLDDAYRALAEFRAGFSYPLTKVAMGLRSMVSCESDSVRVGQRLKREPQIINKLVRQPGMLLARMEDIGGCRAVLPSPAAMTGVENRIRKRWEVLRYRDYVEDPKASGYRAVHLVTERDGKRIEVQLRTEGQQDWADAVESFAARYKLPLKDESGPDPVLEFFRIAGEGIYCDEYLLPLPDDFGSRYREAERAVEDWIQSVD